MAAAVLTIDSIPKSIETCQPNLMPFNISYSGPAEIVTFMNVKRAEPAEQSANTPEASGSQEQSSLSTIPPAEALAEPLAVKDESGDVAMSPAALDIVIKQEKEASESTPTTHPEATADRFVSSFRGRIIQGLTVDLPEGYGGLVLRSAGSQPTASTSKSSSNSKAKAPRKDSVGRLKPRGRLTRSAASSKRVVDVDEHEIETLIDDGEDDADAMNVDEPTQSGVEGPVATKNLVPSAQFSSFVLWRPDNPVVEIQDEYIRSMQEWTALAAEIHRSEEVVA